MTKRKHAEWYLGMLAEELSLCISASDPYSCDDEDEIIAASLGLVYRDRDGCWWNAPSTEQVNIIIVQMIADDYIKLDDIEEG